MHSERCTSGSARGHAKLPVARSARRACSTQPYIPMRRGFLYLCVIMDWATRRVLSWRLSNTLTTDFCTAALKEALARHGTPEIFNTDQFTSAEFTGVLIDNQI